MASKLVEVLGISETQAKNLIEAAGGDMQLAMNLYCSESPAPANQTAAPAGSAPAPVAEPVLPDPEPEEEREEELIVKPGGKMIRVRIATPSGQKDLSVDNFTMMGLFEKQVSEISTLDVSEQVLLIGFPPAKVQVPKTTTIDEAGIKSGEKITVQKGANIEVKQGHTKGKYIPPSASKGSFTKREMPGDNSCLFHSINYVLYNKKHGETEKLRQMIAETVISNPQRFNTTFLGQPNAMYAQWIMQKDTWGGAIECSILSFLLQTEIVALDVQTTRMYRFGEDEDYTTRVFILYSGKHYDAMALAEHGGAQQGAADQVMFNKRDESVLKKATDFIKLEHERMIASGGN
eukprot:TRINITY_DN4443_c0_g1_i1.p1 TRINITY_DN4443_c0_g1~~TRINITY_DN4443_c0_g1_i1.p1  ORF type:complete len:367 (+),score=84.90 TRINITY_DN4443_c0_g1_i1:60-1103(+)